MSLTFACRMCAVPTPSSIFFEDEEKEETLGQDEAGEGDDD